VLDASVVVKWFWEEKFSDIALKIRKLFRDGKIDIAIPDLLFYEVANAVKFNQKLSGKEKAGIVKSVYDVGFDIITHSKKLMEKALSLSLRYKGIAIYDFVYLAIAKDLDTLYVTADKEFCGKTRDKHAIFIGDYAV
jgi:predicted nucleic acid-binding protein